MFLDVDEIMAMQQAAVARWHVSGIDNPYEGLLRIACHQCSLNYLLWHEEDAARSRSADDGEIALIKRTIDQLNQQRNDYVEQIDDWLAARLQRLGVVARDAPLNTETPGSVIDRLAILTLRIFHLQEQAERRDVMAEHHASVRQKLVICCEQQADLAVSFRRLVHDLLRGRTRHKVYRQFKMYNDPNLNPHLYQASHLPFVSPLPAALAGVSDSRRVAG